MNLLPNSALIRIYTLDTHIKSRPHEKWNIHYHYDTENIIFSLTIAEKISRGDHILTTDISSLWKVLWYGMYFTIYDTYIPQTGPDTTKKICNTEYCKEKYTNQRPFCHFTPTIAYPFSLQPPTPIGLLYILLRTACLAVDNRTIKIHKIWKIKIIASK